MKGSPLNRQQLEQDYAVKLAEFVAGAGEAALVEAYELGRRGLSQSIGLLDFALLHHRAAETLASERGGELWGLAAEFFAEALSPYELTLRAYHDSARLLGLGRSTAEQTAEVERAHAQLRTILDATTAVIHLRGDDGKFLFVNRRFEEVFGVEGSDLVDLDRVDALPPNVDAALRLGDERALRLRAPLEVEETFLLDECEWVYLSLKVPLLDEQGAPYAVCSVATDISERKRAQEEIQRAVALAEEANRALRSAQAQLVQAAKMASLGELVAGIAHEINNPLAFVRAHLSTVRKKLVEVETASKDAPPLSERPAWSIARQRMVEINEGLDRIVELVRQLKTFSRIDEGEVKRVHVRESIESVLTILQHRLRQSIEVRLSVGADEQLDCYPGLLNQAVLNLVANAIEALGGEGGTITIDTRTTDERYELCVSDTGPGIPLEIRERIFEPFFTTKAVGEGTGLGLSITYSIMRKHNGMLLLECPEGGGTVVILSFPVSVRH